MKQLNYHIQSEHTKQVIELLAQKIIAYLNSDSNKRDKNFS